MSVLTDDRDGAVGERLELRISVASELASKISWYTLRQLIESVSSRKQPLKSLASLLDSGSGVSDATSS